MEKCFKQKLLSRGKKVMTSIDLEKNVLKGSKLLKIFLMEIQFFLFHIIYQEWAKYSKNCI